MEAFHDRTRALNDRRTNDSQDWKYPQLVQCR